MVTVGRVGFWPSVAGIAAASAWLAGCERPAEPVPGAEAARPVEILEIAIGSIDSGLRFPGRVRAAERAELAFSVSGTIQELPVREGQQVAAGALIARLGSASARNRLAAAQAELDKAEADFERVRRVWEQSQAVPRAEVDQKRTALEVARSSHVAARKDVEDTRLTAPFAGIVARRYVEKHQNVQAREPIVSLQDPRQLEIVIDVPERVVRGEPKRVAGYAEFEGDGGRRVPVTLKSYSTEADPQTQAYEVVLGFPRPDDFTVLPGMPATVFPGEDAGAKSGGVLVVPLKAVVVGTDGAPQVWVVDPASSRAAPRSIRTGPVRDDGVVVEAGLQPGERIVTAGVSHLRDGMLVRPL